MHRLRHATAPTSDFELIHGAYVPASIFSGMGVTATRPASDGPAKPLVLWRLSPQGIEWLIAAGCSYSVGQSVRFDLSLAGQTLAYVGVVVAPKVADGKVLLVGLRYELLHKVDAPMADTRESREHDRFLVHAKFYPTGVAYAPLTFHDSVLFTVTDLSSTGMRLSTSMRNKFLVPGLVLTAQVHFPPMASTTVKLLICNTTVVREPTGDAQALGVHIIDRDSALSQAMGQYILQFGQTQDGLTPALIENQDLTIQDATQMIDWGFAETLKDFKDLTTLRLISNPLESKKNIETAMAFDDHSRFLIGRFRGQLIASLRLIFCSIPDDRFEIESYTTLPADLADRHGVVEASLMCIHPEFHGADLMTDLMRFAYFVLLQSGRRQIIHVSSPECVPMLCRMGFEDHGQVLPESAEGRAHWHILQADLEGVVEGRHIGFVMWNKLFYGREDHLNAKHLHKVGRIGQVRMATYRLLEPATQLLQRFGQRGRKDA